eukprot:scaffold238016_cov18-Tisochrysis_lutea.AAC.3
MEACLLQAVALWAGERTVPQQRQARLLGPVRKLAGKQPRFWTTCLLPTSACMSHALSTTILGTSFGTSELVYFGR